MRITERKLRQLIREELIREAPEDVELPAVKMADRQTVERTPEEQKAAYVMAVNSMKDMRWRKLDDKTGLKWDWKAWMNSDGSSSIDNIYWGLVGGEGQRTFTYILYPGDENCLIGSTDARAGGFDVEVYDVDTGETLLRKTWSRGHEQFMMGETSDSFSVRDTGNGRGHEVEIRISARGVPQTDLILGMLLWRGVRASNDMLKR